MDFINLQELYLDKAKFVSVCLFAEREFEEVSQFSAYYVYIKAFLVHIELSNELARIYLLFNVAKFFFHYEMIGNVHYSLTRGRKFNL